MLLDSFQAGLSWSIILKKRAGFRQAFAGFDPAKIALFNEDKFNELIINTQIIRNKIKILAAIGNAKKFIALQDEFGSFQHYIWGFVDFRPTVNKWETEAQIPATSSVSDEMSTDLKRRGFKFVGSTICYAFMQAAGLVNDHLVHCFRHPFNRKLKHR